MKVLLLLALVSAAVATVNYEHQCAPMAEIGFCKLKLERWFYNEEKGKCQIFYYSGCGGNENRYETLFQCERACSGKQATEKRAEPSSAGTVEHVCNRPAHRGPCIAHMHRFYYDQEAGTCNTFIYGGCLSNGNNFDTYQGCMQACSAKSA